MQSRLLSYLGIAWDFMCFCYLGEPDPMLVIL